MRTRITTIVAVACMAFAASVSVSPAGATEVKPNLCRFECGGSWGAFEHAEAYAKKHGDVRNVVVENCENLGTNKKGETQWRCWGHGESEIIGGGWRLNKWEVGMDPYGYETYWRWL